MHTYIYLLVSELGTGQEPRRILDSLSSDSLTEIFMSAIIQVSDRIVICPSHLATRTSLTRYLGR